MATFLGYSNFNGRNGDKFSADLLYDILEQNIAGNYYIVRLYGYIRSWGYSGSGAYAHFYINGADSGGFSSIAANQYSEVARRDIRIDGNALGECNLDWSLFVDTTWSLGDASASGSIPLPTIPRTSSVTCTDGKIESSISININRASDIFTHNLRYAFGTLSGTIASGVTTSYGWTVPTSFYSQIPNSKTGQGTIYCDTYANGNLIGISSCVLNIGTDESKCKPTVTATIVDTNQDAIALTGDENKLIRFISNPKITTVAEAKNNATITSIKVECADGKSDTGNEVTLNKVESGKFTISAIDSRTYVGTTNPSPIEKEMILYIPLTLNASFERIEPTTGEVKLSLNGNYYNGSFGEVDNTLTIKYRYKEKNNTEWSEYVNITPTIDEENNKYYQSLKLEELFDYQKLYEFEIISTDKLCSSKQADSITEGIPVLALFEDNIEMFGSKTFDDAGNLYLPEDTEIYSGENPIIKHDSTNKETIVATDNSNIVLRPNGYKSKNGQVFVSTYGELYLPETARLFGGTEKFLTHSAQEHHTTLASHGGNIYFRPNGGDSDVAQTYITPSGNMNVAGALYSNAYYLKDGNKAIVSTSVHIANIVKGSKVYLELGTNNIDGVGAWGVDVWASDKRLKNSIKDTKVNALDIIKQIKHREFKYNNNDNLVKIGYVADELQEIDDELIFEVGEDKLKQPSTSYIIPLLSKAIQEQQEQIEKLKKEIESLKKES